MVINDRYRFVFVHNPKAAGTSITDALRQLDGNNSVALGHKLKHETGDDFLRRHGLGIDAPMPGSGGIPIGAYLFFCFVRNPWDRFCSLHRYLRRRGHPSVPADIDDFAALLERGEPWVTERRAIRRQTDYIGPPTGFVGRYETLAADFARVCERLGLPFSDIPHLNATDASHGQYREQMSDRSRDLIARLYADDIARLGYRF